MGVILAAAVSAGHAQASSHSTYTNRPDKAARTAIAYARHRIGCPYVWAGTGPCPAGYDCSGLVMEAYASAGKYIPRTAAEQWFTLRHVPAREREPGDLVFFAGADGTATDPGHVGLVISRRWMVEAYATGFSIRISQYGTADSAPGDGDPIGFAEVG